MFFRPQQKQEPLNQGELRIAVAAASCGWLGVLRERNARINIGEICGAAIRHGQLEVLKWLENTPHFQPQGG